MTDLDTQSLIEEVMKRDMYSFIMTVTTTLDKRFRTAISSSPIEDDPSLKAPGGKMVKSSSSLFPKLLRLKKKRK